MFSDLSCAVVKLKRWKHYNCKYKVVTGKWLQWTSCCNCTYNIHSVRLFLSNVFTGFFDSMIFYFPNKNHSTSQWSTLNRFFFYVFLVLYNMKHNICFGEKEKSKSLSTTLREKTSKFVKYTSFNEHCAHWLGWINVVEVVFCCCSENYHP